jgi:hypothetical protein
MKNAPLQCLSILDSISYLSNYAQVCTGNLGANAPSKSEQHLLENDKLTTENHKIVLRESDKSQITLY